jgi:hypothetical protein
MDLNHRPPGPEPGALARLRYAPTAALILQTKREDSLTQGTVGAERRFTLKKARAKKKPPGNLVSRGVYQP